MTGYYPLCCFPCFSCVNWNLQSKKWSQVFLMLAAVTSHEKPWEQQHQGLARTRLWGQQHLNLSKGETRWKCHRDFGKPLLWHLRWKGTKLQTPALSTADVKEQRCLCHWASLLTKESIFSPLCEIQIVSQIFLQVLLPQFSVNAGELSVISPYPAGGGVSPKSWDVTDVCRNMFGVFQYKHKLGQQTIFAWGVVISSPGQCFPAVPPQSSRAGVSVSQM